MIDLNHIFLFIAIASPLAVLVLTRAPGHAHRGWRIAAVIVLIVTGASWILFRKEAGFIGGGAWVALLFLPAVGLKRVTELSAAQRYKSARRLAAILRWLHPTAELRQEIQMLRELESRANTRGADSFSNRPYPAAWRRPARSKITPAIQVIIFLNVVAFAIELRTGSGADPYVLHRLGALEPGAVLERHEYWRLFTALFLHYDVVHLLFNVFALYVIGPPLERAIGAARFCVCYLLSGIGSTGGVVLLSLIHGPHALQLIGASGSVMGIVGAWAGFLLRHRHAPLARQRLQNIALIVAIQTAFDLTTPQISMSAHLCGLFTGLLVGLVISPRNQSQGMARTGDLVA